MTTSEAGACQDKFQRYLDRTGLDKKDYQVKGVEWCIERETKGIAIHLNEKTTKIIRGGIMADEMGLGKTIQMLGTVVCNFKRQTLIVLPRALLDQWANAIAKTLGHHALIYHAIPKKNKAAMNVKLQSSPIVITTYGMIAVTKKQKKQLSPLHDIEWSRIIFDEAHHLRNKSTGEYGGALKLKAAIVWMVTGTPIQNRVSDLYSLLDILKVPQSYYLHCEEILHELTTQLILHRTKAGVGLILPALSADTESIKWKNKIERNLAERLHRQIGGCYYIAEGAEGTGAEGAGTTSAEGTLEEDEDGDDGPVLLKILRARQVCILAALLNAPQQQKQPNSSKIKAVIAKIVERKENGKHKLVFCHYRGEIDFIKAILVNDYQMNVSVIDGRTKINERRKILEQAAAATAAEEQASAGQAQGEILILQIQTGCEGLNLQKFSEVYFVSPHWNPAVEEQAIARCHRIGQTAETDVFRFYMNGFASASDAGAGTSASEAGAGSSASEAGAGTSTSASDAGSGAGAGGIVKKRSLDEYISIVQLKKKEIVTKILW